MSTQATHAPSAPELPTSTQAEASAPPAESMSGGWTYFDNSLNGTEQTSPTTTAPKPSQTQSEGTVVNSTSDDAAAGAAAAAAAATSNTTNTTTSTSYSFTGSALGSDSTANIKSLKTETSSTTTNGDSTANKKEEEKMDDSIYECNICLDTAKDAVVSMCGHLFCWPCLHQWLETRPNNKLCPVCKAAIGKDKVIPLYGRNSAKQEDPRNKVPPRPAGQRSEPEPAQGFQGFGFGDGFHMSFGIGAFPFGYFASSFNFGEPRAAAANRGTTQYDDEQQLSKLFLYLAVLCIAWLLFA